VDDRHRLALVGDRVLDRCADEALGPLLRYRLDANAGTGREANLLHAHLVLQELDDLPAALGIGFPLDAGVDVLGVLAEDDHVRLGRVLER